MHLYMIKDMSDELPPLNLPERMTIRSFRPGDEVHWDRIIQRSFQREPEKLNFIKTMAVDERYKEENILFLCLDGHPVATATAWETNPRLGYIHYVGTDPDHRGLRAGITSAWPLCTASGRRERLGRSWIRTTSGPRL